MENKTDNNTDLNNVQSRRRQPNKPKVEEKIEDFFEQPQSNSKFSEGLSAFEIPKAAQNSQLSGNTGQKKDPNEPDSKKSVDFDPFGPDAEINKSKVSQESKSLKFFDDFQKSNKQISSNLFVP